MRDWAKFAGFAALLVVALAGSLFWALENPPQNTQWTCKTQTNTKNPNSNSVQSLICQPTQPDKLNNVSQGTESHSHENTSDSLKVTDKLVAVFTGWLVVVGAVQGFYLFQTSRVAERALTGLERPRIMISDWNFGIVGGNKRAQIGFLNVGRDPGCIVTITGKFFPDKLPTIPDFTGAEIKVWGTWVLPASSYDQPRQGRVAVLFDGPEESQFFVGRVFYRWDFGEYDYAFACTAAVAPTAIPESVGGNAYNYEKKRG